MKNKTYTNRDPEMGKMTMKMMMKARMKPKAMKQMKSMMKKVKGPMRNRRIYGKGESDGM